MLWQLKKLSTNENLTEAGKLPENWGPIFGLAGITEKLGDLSWLGEAYADMGWVQVEGELPSSYLSTPEDIAWETAKKLLRESDWSMLPDVPLNATQKSQWEAYRKSLREIRSHVDFPNMAWPVKPADE